MEVYSWENHLETVNFPLPYLDLTIKDDEDKPSTAGIFQLDFMAILNKMKPTNPNAHTYVNGTDVKTHGYAVTHNTFLQ